MVGVVEALAAHKLPSAATVWWRRALKPSTKSLFICLSLGAVSNPKRHFFLERDVKQAPTFPSPQIALQGLETLLLLKRRAPLLCQVTCMKSETVEL